MHEGSTTGERWLPVVGWEGLYSVSDDGRVRNTRRGRLLSGRGHVHYPAVLLHGGGGKPTLKRVHRLVLEAFVGPCPNGMEACHIDGDRTNNRLTNLRWDTPRSNMDDKIRHGTTGRGPRNPQAKLTDASVREIRRLFTKGVKQAVLARRYGVTKYCVWDIVHRRRWSHLD